MSLAATRVRILDKWGYNLVCRLAFNSTTAAEACAVDETVIEIAVREHQLPAHQCGTEVIILRKDLEAWLGATPDWSG